MDAVGSICTQLAVGLVLMVRAAATRSLVIVGQAVPRDGTPSLLGCFQVIVELSNGLSARWVHPIPVLRSLLAVLAFGRQTIPIRCWFTQRVVVYALVGSMLSGDEKLIYCLDAGKNLHKQQCIMVAAAPKTE